MFLPTTIKGAPPKVPPTIGKTVSPKEETWEDRFEQRQLRWAALHMYWMFRFMAIFLGRDRAAKLFERAQESSKKQVSKCPICLYWS